LKSNESPTRNIEDLEDLNIDDNIVRIRIISFINKLLPNAIVIREFNGNFVFQVILLFFILIDST
jgi:hypothetical protein